MAEQPKSLFSPALLRVGSVAVVRIGRPQDTVDADFFESLER